MSQLLEMVERISPVILMGALLLLCILFIIVFVLWRLDRGTLRDAIDALEESSKKSLEHTKLLESLVSELKPYYENHRKYQEVHKSVKRECAMIIQDAEDKMVAMHKDIVGKLSSLYDMAGDRTESLRADVSALSELPMPTHLAGEKLD